MRKIAVALLLAVALSGCPKPEQVAYETVVGSKAFIDKVKSQHPECDTGATSAVCADLTKATAAKDSLIDIAETLCAGPNFNTGGACDFPKKGTPGYQQAVDKLNAAIASYNATAKDLKGAL